jgi:hypothetical protein
MKRWSTYTTGRALFLCLFATTFFLDSSSSVYDGNDFRLRITFTASQGAVR